MLDLDGHKMYRILEGHEMYRIFKRSLLMVIAACIFTTCILFGITSVMFQTPRSEQIDAEIEQLRNEIDSLKSLQYEQYNN